MPASAPGTFPLPFTCATTRTQYYRTLFSYRVGSRISLPKRRVDAGEDAGEDPTYGRGGQSGVPGRDAEHPDASIFHRYSTNESLSTPFRPRQEGSVHTFKVVRKVTIQAPRAPTSSRVDLMRLTPAHTWTADRIPHCRASTDPDLSSAELPHPLVPRRTL